MNQPPPPSIAELLANPRIIEAAVQRGVREAVRRQALLGYPVAALRDGQVVWLEPSEVLAQLPKE
ncbi:MAG TPA: hypothetical protein VJ739_14065 [Gemmataceae bacterium]|nr:hypothetical protein [Gemmataceae bacterium]